MPVERGPNQGTAEQVDRC